MTLTNLSGETIATPPAGDFCAFDVASKPPSVKSLQPGDSTPVSLVGIRQVDNTVNIFFGLESRKASGLRCAV